MNLTNEQIQTIRAALIAGREHYCRDMDEYGDDGMETPEPDIKAAMELMGMTWGCDVMEIFKGHTWAGNEAFKPKSCGE